MWDGVSALLESVAAYLILGEKLNKPYQYIGLGVIILGIFILHSGGISK
jgi:multidrug transporter EmrE-like cation transporter